MLRLHAKWGTQGGTQEELLSSQDREKAFVNCNNSRPSWLSLRNARTDCSSQAGRYYLHQKAPDSISAAYHRDEALFARHKRRSKAERAFGKRRAFAAAPSVWRLVRRRAGRAKPTLWGHHFPLLLMM